MATESDARIINRQQLALEQQQALIELLRAELVPTRVDLEKERQANECPACCKRRTRQSEGGKKGAANRAMVLNDVERAEIASKAAKARWHPDTGGGI